MIPSIVIVWPLLLLSVAAQNSQWSDLGLQQTITDGGAPVARRIIEVQCLPQNWAPGAANMTYTITAADQVTTYTMSLRCRPPRYTYSLQRMYYVPRNAKLYISEVLLTSNPQLLAQTIDDILVRSRAVPAMKRRMKALHVREQRLLKRGHVRLQQALHTLRQKHATLQGLSFREFACGSILNTFATLSGSCKNDFPSKETIDAMQQGIETVTAAAADLKNKFATVFAKEQELENNVFEQFQQQQYFNQQIKDAVTGVRDMTRTAMNQANAAMDATNTLAIATKNQFASVYSELSDLYVYSRGIANEVSALAIASNDQYVELIGRINTNAERTNYMVSNVTSRLQGLSNEMNLRDYTQQQSLRLLMGQFIRTVSRFQENVQHTIDMRAKITEALASGYTPFVTSLGTAPLAPGNTVIEIDNVRVRYWLSSNTQRIREEIISFKCAASFVTNNLGYSQQPGDIIQALGPQGCTPGTDCDCHVEWSFKECTAVSDIRGAGTGGISNADYFKAGTSRFVRWFTVNSSMCSGSLQQGPLVGSTVVPELVTNSTRFLQRMRDMNTAAFDHAESSFVVTTAYYRRAARAEYDPDGSILEMIDILRPRRPFTAVASVMRMINAQQGGFSATPEALSQVINGVGPSYTLYDYPLLNINGTTVSGSQAVFIAVDGTWLPVYRMRPSGQSAVLDVTVRRDCSDPGDTVCAADVRTFSSVSADLGNSMAHAMPSNTKIVGSPFGDSGNYVYNVDPDDVGAAAVASGHIGKVSYMWCINNTNALCTPAGWAARSQGQKFDAYDASNVAGLYRQRLVWDPISSVYRCASLDSVGDPSSMCRFLEDFNVRPGSSNNLTVITEPRTVGDFKVRFEIPVGTISNVYVSDCPLVQVASQTSRGVTLNLYNPNLGAISVRMTLSSPCCTYSAFGTVIEIAGSATYPVLVPPCEASCRTVRASFTRLNGLGCESGQNINVTAPTDTEAFQRFGVIDTSFLNKTTRIAIDTARTEAQQSIVALTSAMLEQTTLMIQMLRLQGLDLMAPDLDMLGRAANISRTALAIAANAAAGETRTSNVNLGNFDDLVAANRAIQDANNAKFAFQGAQVDRIINNITAIQAIQSNLLNAYNETRTELIGARSALLVAIENYTNASTNVLKLTVQAFQQVREGGFRGGGLGGLFDIGDMMTAVVEAGSSLKDTIVDLGEQVISTAVDLAKQGMGLLWEGVNAVLDKVLGVFNSLKGALAQAALYLGMFAGVVVGVYILYRLIMWQRERSKTKGYQGMNGTILT